MNATASEHNGMRELIAFRIGEQEYCIDIMQVREIRGFATATPLPHSPGFVVGVINLRGTILPIIDLSDRLGFDPIRTTPRSVIIVVERGQQLVGLLVDGVSDIISADDDLLQPTPEIASTRTHSFVRGVMTFEGRMISMIAVDALVPDERLAA
ncbi:chemotaxis protein CheW [Aureimonas psammosilenae]|uniref:chemotaxis protein CheW n=1 Tax=Aureimonas psammosilenae TaxID=2495496 RepID=UPI0012608F4A|nr:chemotaxis protein CheW [Aureimonas psammosilenae]